MSKLVLLIVHKCIYLHAFISRFATDCRYIESDKTIITTDREKRIVVGRTTARKRSAKRQQSRADEMPYMNESMRPAESKGVSAGSRSLLEKYHCGRCEENFSTACALSSHINSRHELVKTNDNVDICEASRNTVTNDRLDCSVLSKPLSRSQTACDDVVSELSTESSWMQYTCDKLWRTADMPRNLFETSLNSELSSSELSSQPTVDIPQQPAAEKANHPREIYLCELCGMIFNCSQKLNSHKVVHVGERNPFFCAECGRQFHYMHSLRRHVLVQHRGELPNLCQYCGKGYRSWHGLRDHVLSLHHADFLTTSGGFSVDGGDPRFVPYSCRVCGKTFTTRKRLAAHIRQEQHQSATSGRRSCVSDNSPVLKGSSSMEVASSVTVAVEIVNGYSCAACGRRYTTRAGRNAHVRMKHGVCERPYKCTICGRRYTTPSSLRYHSVSHCADRPHKCPKCSRHFKTHTALARHSVQHSDHRPHVCSTCSKSFAFLGQLNGHRKQVHGSIRGVAARLKSRPPQSVLVAAYSAPSDRKGPSIVVMSAD